MLSQFQASYQRVESSLQRLTESIAAYNPSISAADELVAANDAVNENLDQLVTHQTNHVRIQELRQTTESLDETLKNTLKLLADTRKEILAIPSSASEEPRRKVKVDELLAYAKFISPTTVPPTFRKQDLPMLPAKSDNAKAQITNGMATPPQAAQDSESAAYVRSENVGTKAMKEGQKRLLDPLAGLPFEPWPSRDVMQRGALGYIQRMIENGQDPGSVLTAEEQAEADRKKKENEEMDKKALEEAERRRMSMFDTGAMRRRPTVDVFDPDDI